MLPPRRIRGRTVGPTQGRGAAWAGVGLLAFIFLMTSASPGALGKTLMAGAGKTYPLPSAAIAAAAPGDTVEIYPGEYFDCAVVPQDRLTIVGIGDGVVLTDKICQGKAILVTTGSDITVRNLTLTRARAPDSNGAGIRAEGTNLLVDRVRFINDENGILAAENGDSTIRVMGSQFERDGKCAAACAHGIYADHIKLLHVENSHFSNTRDGHHIKSRAARTEVITSTIEDGPDGTASYLVEAPNGGSLVMIDDTLEKGPKTGNHAAAVVIGAEGVTQRTPELIFKNVTFTNDYAGQTIFVRNLTATEAQITGAKFRGNKIVPLEGDGSAS
jgi:hypothetical protein